MIDGRGYMRESRLPLVYIWLGSNGKRARASSRDSANTGRVGVSSHGEVCGVCATDRTTPTSRALYE